MMPIIIPTGLKTRGYLTSRLPDAISSSCHISTDLKVRGYLKSRLTDDFELWAFMSLCSFVEKTHNSSLIAPRPKCPVLLARLAWDYKSMCSPDAARRRPYPLITHYSQLIAQNVLLSKSTHNSSFIAHRSSLNVHRSTFNAHCQTFLLFPF